MNQSEYKLIEINYIPDPKEYFRYIQFFCQFKNAYNHKYMTLCNDAISDYEALWAIVVLTAWMIKHPLGAGIQSTITFTGDKCSITLNYIDKLKKTKFKRKINQSDLPKYVIQAVNLLRDALTTYYNNL